MRAGISSENNSSRSSGMRPAFFGSRIRLVREPRLAAGFRQRTDPSDISSAFRHRDHAAGVEKVESVTRLDALVVGRQRQLLVEQTLAFLFGVREMPKQNLGVGMLEIMRRVFALGLL